MTDWKIVDDDESLSRLAASLFLDAVDENPSIRLGLPTGSTPIGMYDEIVRLFGSGNHSLGRVRTFNLDEYVGIRRDDPGSYFTYMRQHLFDRVDISSAAAHVPCGDPKMLAEIHAAPFEEALKLECNRYERLIEDHGGIDLIFLGLGSNSHIAFNEPGTPFDSRTHVVTLRAPTIAANARFFPTGVVPSRAITMGIGTILAARRIVLLASGTRKRKAINALRLREISEDVPASALHSHSDVLVICDRNAAGQDPA